MHEMLYHPDSFFLHHYFFLFCSITLYKPLGMHTTANVPQPTSELNPNSTATKHFPDISWPEMFQRRYTRFTLGSRTWFIKNKSRNRQLKKSTSLAVIQETTKQLCRPRMLHIFLQTLRHDTVFGSQPLFVASRASQSIFTIEPQLSVWLFSSPLNCYHTMSSTFT